MLLRRDVLEGLSRGEIDLAFRRWKRPTVKTGGTLRTAAGMIRIDRVVEVDVGSITPDQAARAGLELDDLLEFLDAKDEGAVYRVELGGFVPDPRVALREDDRLGEGELAEVESRLERLDQMASRGPWTRQFLQLIRDRPHVRAQDLADEVGLERDVFKGDVRKLKALGLTISHSPGYELSPRGKAVLASLGDLPA